MSDSNLVVLGSQDFKGLLVFKIIFDQKWSDLVQEQIETDFYPFALHTFDGKHTLVLWKDAPYRSLVRVFYQGSVMQHFPKSQNSAGNDISADYNRYPLKPESDPKVAILLTDNKIEILTSSTMIQEKMILIEEWAENANEIESKGTVLFLPNSNLLVAAKVGQKLIVFKNYLDDIQNADFNILTVFDSMYHLIIPERHKLLVVFDKNMDLMAYYSLSNMIGCPPDENVKSCGPIFVYEDIECLKNFSWNPVLKKCQCSYGFYYDASSKQCEKCNCQGFYSQCYKTSTDCNEEPFLTVALRE
jgi:hypothetical protein